MEKQIKLRVLFLKENDSWVAQCLDYDIAAQAKTIEALKLAFNKTICGQCFMDLKDKKEPLGGIGPAPDEYFTKFETAERLAYTVDISDTNPAAKVEDARVALA
jgi:hypothetical protein